MKRYDPAPFFARLSALGMTQTELARQLGCDRSTVALWVKKGVSESYADAAAVIVGLTPANLWPEWLDDEIERAEAERRQKAAAKKRRERSTNPDYAERQRAYARRYKAENAAYIKAQYQRYYEENRERILGRLRERRQEAKAS